MDALIQPVCMWSVNLLVTFNFVAQGVNSLDCMEEDPSQPYKVPACCKTNPSDPEMKKEQERVLPKELVGRDKVMLVSGPCPGEWECPRQLGEECGGEGDRLGKCDIGLGIVGGEWLRCKCDSTLEKAEGRNCTYDNTKDRIFPQPVHFPGRCVPYNLFRNNTDRFIAKDTTDVKDYAIIPSCTKTTYQRVPACETMHGGVNPKSLLYFPSIFLCNGTCEIEYNPGYTTTTCSEDESLTTKVNTATTNKLKENNSATTFSTLSDEGEYLIGIMVIVGQLHFQVNCRSET